MATVDTILAQPQAAQTQAGGKKTAHEFWSDYLCSMVRPLLEASGAYTPEQQAQQLRFLVDHIAPTLGPLPSEARAKYTMTYVDSPFEPSLNLTGTGKCKVRYSLEVVKPPGGAESPDPFGEKRAREVLLNLAKASGADTKWLTSVMDLFYLTPEETEAMRNKIPTFMPSSLVGFDLDGEKAMMKVYILTMRKAIASGAMSSNQYTVEALRKLEPWGYKIGPGLDVVSDYLANAKYNVTLIFASLDCLDPFKITSARVKTYFHTSSNSFAVARDVMTLGGRLTDETTLKRVEILRSLWPLLRNEKPGEGPDPSDRDAYDAWEKPERITGTPLSGLQYNVELNPSKPGLEMKCYVPLFQHNATAQESEANVEKILRKLQHQWGSDGKYTEAVKAAYASNRISPTFVSFSYSKSKGPYMSSYLPGVLEEGAELKSTNWKYT
ncbi:aromatic prenyltransferase [Chaetomium fimeti]|jgi:DMATS type aromatic prenyltransferase|uniref:Aromatic prenyltransferase n=1 Tax=Chaetomium fimeti TaxID=1854472 RepID=A0AAE0HET9_9PEZI|nr:aromatic prenyltransferase [Chaetomium fimeti]